MSVVGQSVPARQIFSTTVREAFCAFTLLAFSLLSRSKNCNVLGGKITKISTLTATNWMKQFLHSFYMLLFRNRTHHTNFYDFDKPIETMLIEMIRVSFPFFRSEASPSFSDAFCKCLLLYFCACSQSLTFTQFTLKASVRVEICVLSGVELWLCVPLCFHHVLLPAPPFTFCLFLSFFVIQLYTSQIYKVAWVIRNGRII